MKEFTQVEIDSNFTEYINLLKTVKRDGIDNLINWLESKDTKIAPASTKYHLATKGGLVKHSLNVYNKLKQLVESDPNVKGSYSDETLIIVALLHDISKVEFYDIQERNAKDENGNWTKVPYYAVKHETERLIFDSHPINSYYMINKFIKLTYEEELAVIHHEGAFDHCMDNLQLANVMSAFKKSPLVLMLHYADMYSTCVTEGNNE